MTTAQVFSSSDLFMTIPSKRAAEILITSCQYRDLSTQEMARLVGFTPAEMQFVSFFWNKVHNAEWILLTHELISTYLSNEKGRNALSHFIDRHLKNNEHFKDGVDYKEIDEDELSTDQYNNLSPTVVRTHGNQQLMTITIKTFKICLMKSHTEKAYTFANYLLKVEQLSIMTRDFMSLMLKHKLNKSNEQNLMITRELKSKKDELQNYNVIHHLELEQETINAYHKVFGAYKHNKHIDKGIFYVLWVGTKVINGVVHNIYKYGISASGAVRMSAHKKSFGHGLKKLYIQSVTYGSDAETLIKRYLESQDALVDSYHDLKDHHQVEIFTTRADFKLHDILIKCRSICDQETDPRRVQCINNDLSHMIENQKQKITEYKNREESMRRELDDARGELANLRAQLIKKSEECAAAQTEAKVYKQMTDKLTSVIPNIAAAKKDAESQTNTEVSDDESESESDSNSEYTEDEEEIPEPGLESSESEAEEAEAPEPAAAPVAPTLETHRVCVTCDRVLLKSAYSTWPSGKSCPECTVCNARRAPPAISDQDRATAKVCSVCGILKVATCYLPKSRRCDICSQFYRLSRSRVTSFDSFVQKEQDAALNRRGLHQCSKCKQAKSIDEFSFNSNGANGLKRQCYECRRAEYAQKKLAAMSTR